MHTQQSYFTNFIKPLAIGAMVLLYLFGIINPIHATSGINRTINFQGKVVNKTAGTNVTNGSYAFVFAIYDASSGGTKLWGDETQSSITVTDGIFRVALGSVRTFATDNLNFNQDNLWLDITFNGENFGSRVRLTAVPYAFEAERVSGLAVTNNGGNTLNIAANKTFTVSNTLTLAGTDSTSFTFPSTGGGTVIVSNIAGQTISGNLNLGDLTLGASDTSATLTTADTNEDLTIDPNGSGTIFFHGATYGITSGGALTVASCSGCGGGSTWSYSSPYLYPANATDFVGIGSTTTSQFHGLLTVTGARAGKAQTILNYTGTDQNILVASNSGTLKFAINKDGEIGIYGSDAQAGFQIAGQAFAINSSGQVQANDLQLAGGLTSDIDTSGSTTLTIGATNASAIHLAKNGTPIYLDAGTNSIYLTGYAGDNVVLAVDSGGDFIRRISTNGNSQCLLSTGVGGNPTWGTCVSGNITATSLALGTNPAAAGTLMIPNNTYITARNAANSADINLIKIDGSNLVAFGANTAAFTLGGAITGNSQSITGVNALGAATLTTSSTASISGTLTIGNGTTNQLRSAYGPLQLAYKSAADAWTNGLTVEDVTGDLLVANDVWISTDNRWFGSKNASNRVGIGVVTNGSDVPLGAMFQAFGRSNAGTGITPPGGAEFIIDSSNNLTEFNIVEYNGGWGTLFTVNTDGNVFLDGSIDRISAGTLGLGTTTNTTALTIGNSGATSGITFNVDTAAHYTFQKEGSVYQCSGTDKLTLDSSGHLVCGTDQTGAAGDTGLVYDSANGILRSQNQTVDFLWGATSTSSATLRIARPDTRASNSTTGDLEPLLTVGNSATRGTLDVYGDVVKQSLTKLQALTNINDIFIYDTTSDSNLGSWRDSLTSQQLSWYTEAKDDGAGDACNIASDDRCSGSEFPRKAILVTTNDALYIFDQSNGKLWMKFSQNASGYALGVDTNNNPSGVYAINGVIYVGANGSAGAGIYVLDFVTDRLYNIDNVDRSQGDKNIANRNTAVTYNTDNNTKYILVDKIVNDVHGTIVQGNTANGNILLAAATDTGVSVINLTLPQTLSYSDNTNDDYNAVYVTKRGRLYALNETAGGGQLEKWLNVDSDIASELNGTPDKTWDETTTPALSKSSPTIQVSPDDLEVTERTSMSDDASDTIYVGTNQGLSVIHANTTEASGFAKYYTKDYITDELVGNVKAFFPFNEASGTLVDASLLANNLTAKGSPTYGVDGIRGTALSYNNSTSHLCSDVTGDGTCETDTDYNTAATQFLISVWFKHSTSAPGAGTDALLDRSYSTTPAVLGGWRIWMNTSGQMVFGVDEDVTWTNSVPTDDQGTTAASYADGQWHHLLFARSSSTAGFYMYIDGKLVASDTTIGSGSLPTGAILGVGSDCSVGAACATGANFWDGSIDDFEFSAENVTSANLQIYARRMFEEGRATSMRKTISVTDATSVSSTTIGDSGESWTPNEFVGGLVEITGNTGVGQTRRIVANTATVMTVSPAWTTTPDTTSDFQVNPEEIYGATNTVKAIGLQDSFTGEHRKLYIGTNDGSDGGGVTVFNNVGANFVTDVYHADAKKTDDSATEWTGTDYDDVQAIADTNGVIAMGSLAHLWLENEGTSLQRTDDLLSNYVQAIRLELRHDGLGALTPEQGYVPGADLAEKYTSLENLSAGELVAVDTKNSEQVVKTQKAYQKDMIGIVATDPGLVLATETANSYPITLVGRVPLKVSLENGLIKAGDRLTSSSIPGFAMKATQSGRVIGVALEDLNTDNLVNCGPDDGMLCGVAKVFVNLTDYQGQPVEVAMEEKGTPVLDGATVLGEDSIQVISENGMTVTSFSKQQQILNFLKDINKKGTFGSEIFTGRISASSEVISPTIFTDLLVAKKIKADSIEGLDLLINNITLGRPSTQSAQIVNASAVLSESDKVASIAADLDARLATLSALPSATPVSDGSLRVKGNGLFEGILNVIDTITTNNFIVNGLASFFGDVVFRGNTQFSGVATFNSDAGGAAVIKKGERRIEVKFDKEYKEIPIIQVSNYLPEIDESLYQKYISDSICDETDSQDECQSKVENNVYYNNLHIITKKSTKGFTILLQKEATTDRAFSWIAVSVSSKKDLGLSQ